MANSVTTRIAVADYEVLNNDLIKAIQHGGLLHDYVEKGRVDVLLVPRQISLEAERLADYLRYCPAAQEAGAAGAYASSSLPLPSGGCASDKHAVRHAIATTLHHFLDYHLLCFDKTGSSCFTTQRGHRGEFAEALDSVTRYGRLGRSTVLGEHAALSHCSPAPSGQQQDNGVKTQHSANPNPHGDLATIGSEARQTTSLPAPWVAAASCSCSCHLAAHHPLRLQIFFIDRPLMDRQELAEIKLHLSKQLSAAKRHASSANENAVIEDARTTSDAAAAGPCAECETSPPGEITGTETNIVHAHSTNQHCIVKSNNDDLDDTNCTKESHADVSAVPGHMLGHSNTTCSTTGVVRGLVMPPAGVVHGSEDSDDVVQDLTPYVIKSCHQRDHNHHRLSRRRYLSSRSLRKDGSMTEKPTSSGNNNNDVVVQDTNSTVAHGSNTDNRSSCWSSVTSNSSPTAHQYSVESIRDYRHAMQEDNNIQYGEFERMMDLPPCVGLVRIVSTFITRANDHGAIFTDNHNITLLMKRCTDEIQRIAISEPREHKVTILMEGIEKYVTSKLYTRLFAVNPSEEALDRTLRDKLQRAEDLTAAQLDAMTELEETYMWGQAMFELDGMNFFRTPREKLRCGLRSGELLRLAVTEVLNDRQRRGRQATNNNDGAASITTTTPTPSSTHADDTTDNKTTAPAAWHSPSMPSPRSSSHAAPSKEQHTSHASGELAFGADEFFPSFILLVLRAQPYNFYQNIQFIDRFRTPALRSLEESYCLTVMMSAAHFWLNCDDNGRMTKAAEQGGGANAVEFIDATTGAAGDSIALDANKSTPSKHASVERSCLHSPPHRTPEHSGGKEKLDGGHDTCRSEARASLARSGRAAPLWTRLVGPAVRQQESGSWYPAAYHTSAMRGNNVGNSDSLPDKSSASNDRNNNKSCNISNVDKDKAEVNNTVSASKAGDAKNDKSSTILDALFGYRGDTSTTVDQHSNQQPNNNTNSCNGNHNTTVHRHEINSMHSSSGGTTVNDAPLAPSTRSGGGVGQSATAGMPGQGTRTPSPTRARSCEAQLPNKPTAAAENYTFNFFGLFGNRGVRGGTHTSASVDVPISTAAAAASVLSSLPSASAWNASASDAHKASSSLAAPMDDTNRADRGDTDVKSTVMYRLLVTEKKQFEQLTLVELRSIVNETRQWLLQEKGGM